MSSGDRRYPERPILAVGAVILIAPGDPVAALPAVLPAPFGVVLVKRRFEPLAGHWCLPGGVLEIGETLEQAVAREMREETGLIVQVGSVIEVFERIIPAGAARAEETPPGQDAPRVRHHYVIVDYLCRPAGGRLQAGSDASDVVIADPADIATYDVAPAVVIAIAGALEKVRAWSAAVPVR